MLPAMFRVEMPFLTVPAVEQLKFLLADVSGDFCACSVAKIRTGIIRGGEVDRGEGRGGEGREGKGRGGEGKGVVHLNVHVHTTSVFVSGSNNCLGDLFNVPQSEFHQACILGWVRLVPIRFQKNIL